MKANDLVSIIIPSYNHAQYLKEAVQSALNQTYPNIEIIIINDGSTDNTEDIALSLRAKYPEKIQVITQENRGPSEARNNGIEKSSAPYIVTLDADDILNREMVAECMTNMKSNYADIVYTGYARFGRLSGTNLWEPFSKNNILYISACSVVALYKKEVWQKTGGYKQNMNDGYEDWEFWINAYKHSYKFEHLPKVLFYYRRKKVSGLELALRQDGYLKAKIIMNNPEIYTEKKVEEAIKTIQKKEDLAELYFYGSDIFFNNKEKWESEIKNYLQNNEIQDHQILKISDKNICICSLEYREESQSIKELSREYHADAMLFYAPIRYELSSLQNIFAWSYDKGIIPPYGTIFPFVYKAKRSDPKLQVTAYKRLLQYTTSLLQKKEQFSQKQQKVLKKHEESIQKLNKSLDHKNLLLQKKTTTHRELLNAIKQIMRYPILKKPIKKYYAYKEMLSLYQQIKQQT